MTREFENSDPVTWDQLVDFLRSSKLERILEFLLPRLILLSHRYRLDPKWLLSLALRCEFRGEEQIKLLEAMAHAPGMPAWLMNEGVRAMFLLPFVRTAPSLEDAFEALGREEATKLLDTESLEELAARESFTDFFATQLHGGSLCSLDQLVDHLRDFADFLDRNRKELVETGVPRVSFSRNAWLDRTLGKLYCVKPPILICEKRFRPPLSGIEIENVEYFPSRRLEPVFRRFGIPEDFAATFAWRKNPADSQSPRCSYDDAPHLEGLEPDGVEALVKFRERLLEVKISAIARLTVALRKKDLANLRKDTLDIILARLGPKQIGALSYIDSSYGCLFEKKRTSGECVAFLSGGTMNLLRLIGWCEKELKIGTMTKTVGTLQDLVSHDPRVGSDLIASNYFEVIRQGFRDQFEQSLATYRSFEAQEKAFWSEYWEEVGTYLAQKVRKKGIFLPDPVYRAEDEDWLRQRLNDAYRKIESCLSGTGRIGSESPPPTPGPKSDPRIRERKEIVRKHISGKPDFDDDKKFSALLAELDLKRIPPPKSEGKQMFQGEWMEVLHNPFLRGNIVNLLNEDRWRRKK